MRRRLRRKAGPGGKPVEMAWMTTATILVTGFVWYLLHYFSAVSLTCEEVIAWWFDGGRFRPGLLYVSSLLTVTLGLWLYVDIIRPKPVRIPSGIRAGQAIFIAVMIVLSVFQWGFYRPQSDEHLVYAYFEDEVAHWPIINRFLIHASGVEWEVAASPPEDVLISPLFAEFRALEAAYRRDFLDAGIPRDYGVSHGRLECTARREVDAAWERAFDAWFEAQQVQEE
tara:strand:- start:2623 stop:3300 length:678 start_codon:yes stop_codon:yes gene_type:complete